jgi:hypothetical protein
VGVVTARIPFALVGVVLLVSTTTLVGSLRDPVVGQPAVERAMDRVDAATQSALRAAARTAARNAARHPVTVPARTEYGAVLDGSRPFRDALRIRIYLRVRDALDRISERRHGVSVRASVPAVDSPADLRRARERVTVARAGPNGTSLRVSVANVTLRATRDGRVLGTRTTSPTLVVPTPTLAVHDRVRRYERRLQAGPLEHGLGRRLTARLYPVVWARGYAQYRGAPVENVLANRHVALSTNGGALSLQRDLFGHSDPAGRQVLWRVAARTGLRDLLAGSSVPVPEFLRVARQGAGPEPTVSDPEGLGGAADPSVGPETPVTVGIDGIADDAFLTTHRDLRRVLRRTYSGRVHLTQRVRHLGTTQVRAVESPGPGWSHDQSQTRTTVTVRDRDPRPVGPVEATGEHLLGVYGRTVVLEHRTTHWWTGPERGTETTRSKRVERFAVTLALAGNHTLGPAPSRPYASVHERGGPFDGENLADVPPRARQRLLSDRGGVDALAARAARGADVSGTVVVHGERPDALDEWVYADLVGLRERVRNISTTTTRGDLATYRTNPPAVLASKLRERRTDLVGTPERYPNVARRARVAARTAYIDTLLGMLDERARTRNRTESNLRDRLAAASNRTSLGDPLQRLQVGYDRRRDRRDTETPGGLSMRVDAEPAYLTTDAVGHTTVPTLDPGVREHPLVARNRNVVTLPYRDVADAVVGFVVGPDRTRLRTGAQVLRTIAQANVSTAALDRGSLGSQVRNGTRAGERAARGTLSDFGLGDRTGRRVAVRDALGRWETPAARALAMTNGSVATAVHDVAVERWSGRLTDRTRDLLALRLERAIERATTARRARPTEPSVDGTAGRFRTLVRDELATRAGGAIANATEAKIEDATGRSLARLPAGLPVAPAPGFWYATVNLWRVDVAGEYVRFTVRVPRGTPDDPGAQLHYVRDAGTVRLDVDGDGDPERLGRTTRLSFRTGTEIAIAVPPGPQGVGDVDGEAVETSAGWPDPGS